MKDLLKCLPLYLVALSLPCTWASAAVSIYISAPGIETAETSGLTDTNNNSVTANIKTETFDESGVTTGAIPTSGFMSAVLNATYTPLTSTSASIVANGQYGGSGQGQYLGVNTSGSLRLQLPGAGVAYLGFDFYACDGGNSATIYSGSTVLGTFNAASLISLLPSGGMVTEVNGTTISTSGYFGQPGTGLNSGERYAYVDMIATPSTPITAVVFSETGAVFETDNDSVLSTAPKASGNFVYVGALVPEPSSYFLVAAGSPALVSSAGGG